MAAFTRTESAMQVTADTPASIITGQLSPEQIQFVNQIVAGHFGLLPLDSHERVVVGQIFMSLDKTNDGKLQRDDFQHPIPHIHQSLQQVWQILEENFDFNNDGVIDATEFLGYFVLMALFRVEAAEIPGGPIAMQFSEVHQRFTFLFQQCVNEFTSTLSG